MTGAVHAAIANLTPPAPLPASESYAFDGTGNRLLADETSGVTDPSGLILIAIDGTGSYEFSLTSDSVDSKAGHYRSHVRNFFREYAQRPHELVLYYHGPTSECGALGLDTKGIYRTALATILKELHLHPKERVNLVGHSRGGHIVIEIARALKKRGYRVNFLGLYDAVDMTAFFGAWSETIPSNVDYAAHAMRDPQVRSRISFNTVDGGVENVRAMKAYHENKFWCTHAGMGGAPWFGDHPTRTVATGYPPVIRSGPPTISKAQDERNSALVDKWIRECAQKAGISFEQRPPVVKHEVPVLRGNMWDHCVDAVYEMMNWQNWVRGL